MNQRPVAIGILLCDQVIVDVRSRNATPVNCFNSREFPTFPVRTDFYALAYLTNGMGKMSLEVIVERLDTLEEVFRLDDTLQFPDPLSEMRCILKIRQCDFPVPGYYQLSLLIERELVALRRFAVLKKGG